MSRQHTKLLFLITLRLLELKAEALIVRPCNMEKPLPLQVMVDGCDQEPCKVVNKKNIHFSIKFEAPQDIRELKAHAEAFVDNVQLPYEVSKENLNACKFLKDTECPLVKGQIVLYELNAPVDAPVTLTSVELLFEIKDDNDNSIFCLKSKVTIVEN